MVSFAPNISWLFPEIPFKERSLAVSQAGFKAIEFGFPSHVDQEALHEAKYELGLEVVLFNQDVPVWDEANRGYLVDAKRRDEFNKKLDQALQIAERLKVRKIMLPAGVEVPGVDRDTMRQCMVTNLRYAAHLAEQADVLFTIEALNPIDNPGYFLTSSKEGIEIIKEINHPRIRFQFDTYHIQAMEGNLENKIKENLDWIGHIQFADHPGRHEPGTGNLNFNRLLQAIVEAGYQDYIGLEYIPLAMGKAALDWVPEAFKTSLL